MSSFSSDHLSLDVKEESGCQVVFQITVAPVGVEAAYSKAIKTVNKQVSVPGFRKGKAPANVVVQKYQSHVEQEWKNVIIDTSFREAMKLSSINPLMGQRGIKKVDLKSCERESGADLVIELEREPNIPDIDFESLSITPAEPKEVTDDEVAAGLESLQEVYQSYDAVTDRPIEEGDHVDLTIDTVGDNERNLCTDRRFHATEKGMGKWMRDLLIGKADGDEVIGTSEWDESSGTQEEDFKPTEMKIKVSGINSGRLPSVDEELPKLVGCKDQDELHAKLRDDLSQRYRVAAREDTRSLIKKALVDKYTFEIPTSIFDEEVELRKGNRLKAMKAEGIGEALIEEQTAEIDDEARDAVRMTFIARQLNGKLKLDISSEEMQMEYQRQLMYVPEQDRTFLQDMKPEQLRDRIASTILLTKVTDYLLGQLSGASAS
jgi:trigger factor